MRTEVARHACMNSSNSICGDLYVQWRHVTDVHVHTIEAR